MGAQVLQGRNEALSVVDPSVDERQASDNVSFMWKIVSRRIRLIVGFEGQQYSVSWPQRKHITRKLELTSPELGSPAYRDQQGPNLTAGPPGMFA